MHNSLNKTMLIRLDSWQTAHNTVWGLSEESP